MKLPKMPDLPRVGGKPKRAKRDRLPDEEIEITPPEADEVTADPNEQFEERKGVDPTRTGRWFYTGRVEGMIGGRCGKCGRLRKAENLRTYIIPFTSDEIWVCKEGDC